MANLNIPFLILQESASKFRIDASSSRLLCKPNAASSVKLPDDANLMVLVDKDSETMAVCAHDYYETIKQGKATKFVVSLRPKVLCVADIFPAKAKSQIVDYCLIKSPAS